MTIQSDIEALTQATNQLLAAVNVSKASLDSQIADAVTDAVGAAQSASVAAGSFPHDASVVVPTGFVSTTSLVAGSGGTNGVFPLAVSGGGGFGAAGTFTVANGAVSSITITGSGYDYTSAPTLDFSASSGLAGASATAQIGAIVASGGFYWVASSDGKSLDLYVNNSGTPQATNPLVSIPTKASVDAAIQSVSDVVTRTTTLETRASAIEGAALNPFGVTFEGDIIVDDANHRVLVPRMVVARSGEYHIVSPSAYSGATTLVYNTYTYFVLDTNTNAAMSFWYIDMTKVAGTTDSPIIMLQGGSVSTDDLNHVPLGASFGQGFNSSWGPTLKPVATTTATPATLDFAQHIGDQVNIVFSTGTGDTSTYNRKVIFDQVGFYDASTIGIDTFYFPVGVQVYAFGSSRILTNSLSNTASGPLPGYAQIKCQGVPTARAIVLDTTTGTISFMNFGDIQNGNSITPGRYVPLAATWDINTWSFSMDVIHAGRSLAPNMTTSGKTMAGDDITVFNGTGTHVAITDSALTALGFTQGWSEPNAGSTSAIGATFPAYPPVGARVFIRWYVQSSTANTFDGPVFVRSASKGTFHGAGGATYMERQLSPHAASFVFEGYVTDPDFSSFWVGTNTNCVITGLQYHTSADHADVKNILMADYPPVAQPVVVTPPPSTDTGFDAALPTDQRLSYGGYNAVTVRSGAGMSFNRTFDDNYSGDNQAYYLPSLRQVFETDATELGIDVIYKASVNGVATADMGSAHRYTSVLVDGVETAVGDYTGSVSNDSKQTIALTGLSAGVKKIEVIAPYLYPIAFAEVRYERGKAIGPVMEPTKIFVTGGDSITCGQQATKTINSWAFKLSRRVGGTGLSTYRYLNNGHPSRQTDFGDGRDGTRDGSNSPHIGLYMIGTNDFLIGQQQGRTLANSTSALAAYFPAWFAANTDSTSNLFIISPIVCANEGAPTGVASPYTLPQLRTAWQNAVSTFQSNNPALASRIHYVDGTTLLNDASKLIDGVHPTDEGHGIIDANLWSVIQSYV